MPDCCLHAAGKVARFMPIVHDFKYFKPATLAEALRPEERERLKMLVRKPTRTLSGVSVIAAMTSPARCPHGTCVPCPGGINCTSPQSYTGREPAALRAGQHGYDPYDQVRARLGQLDEIGHPLDKAELIIMGGTITSRPLGYQHWFIKRCLEAMNDYPSLPEKGPEWRSFQEVALANESALVRNIGTTFETRPDWCRPEQIQRMLSLGGTKVELGVQSIRDETRCRSNPTVLPSLSGVIKPYRVAPAKRALHCGRRMSHNPIVQAQQPVGTPGYFRYASDFVPISGPIL